MRIAGHGSWVEEKHGYLACFLQSFYSVCEPGIQKSGAEMDQR